MQINVLGIAGSPEIGGNTELLLDKVLEGCRSINNDIDVEKIIVSRLRIYPCASCRTCETTGDCTITNDDMQDVYFKLALADRIAIATPVYFMGVTAQLKGLIDRCQVFWSRKYLLKRPVTTKKWQGKRRGILIATGGNKEPHIFDGLIKTIKSFLATLDTIYDEENSLLINDIEDKYAILKRPEYLKNAYHVGQNLVS